MLQIVECHPIGLHIMEILSIGLQIYNLQNLSLISVDITQTTIIYMKCNKYVQL